MCLILFVGILNQLKLKTHKEIIRKVDALQFENICGKLVFRFTDLQNDIKN